MVAYNSFDESNEVINWTFLEKKPVSKDFSHNLQENKDEILKNLDISSDNIWVVKEETSEKIIENTKSDYTKIKELLNKVNGFLKQAFEDRTKNDYTQWYVHLLKTNDWSFTNWFYKALVSSVNPKWIVVSLFKKGEKIVIPEKNLLKKDTYLRGDEIVVCAEKKDDNFSLMEVDKKFLHIQKQHLLNKTLFYMPKHAKKPFEGKIIGVWEDINKWEVIFMPKSGVQFALGIDTFLEWLKNAETYKQENLKQQKDQIEKKSETKKIEKNRSNARIIWDGKYQYSSKIKGRDWKKVQHEIEVF